MSHVKMSARSSRKGWDRLGLEVRSAWVSPSTAGVPFAATKRGDPIGFFATG
jgi:hypothetical protein